MLVGALLVFAANSKLQGGVPGSLPLVPLAMTAALWYSLTFTEYLFGIPLVLGLKQAIACLSESDFRSAAAIEPAGLV
jgi:hypothetical protein